jgi:hypothetical protein
MALLTMAAAIKKTAYEKYGATTITVFFTVAHLDVPSISLLDHMCQHSAKRAVAHLLRVLSSGRRVDKGMGPTLEVTNLRHWLETYIRRGWAGAR